MINIKKLVAGLSIVTASLLYGASSDGTYTNVYGTITNGGNIMSGGGYSNYGVLSQVQNTVVSTDATYSNYAKLEILNVTQEESVEEEEEETQTPPPATSTPTTSSSTPPPTTEPEKEPEEETKEETTKETEPEVVEVEPEAQPPIIVVLPTEPVSQEPVFEEPEVKPQEPVTDEVIIKKVLDISEVEQKEDIQNKTKDNVTQKDTKNTLDVQSIVESTDDKGTKTSQVQVVNDDGSTKDVKIVVDKDIQTTTTTTDKGLETKTEVLKDDGKTVSTSATLNNNGTTEVKVTTNGGDTNEEKSTTLKSTIAGTDMEIKEDGSVEISVDLTDDDLGKTVTPNEPSVEKTITKSKVTANADSDDKSGTTVELTVVNDKGEEETLQTKTSSDIKESAVIITDDGSVQTNAKTTTKVTDEDGNEKDVDVDVVVETDKFGKLKTELIVTDAEGNKKVVSIDSEVAGTDTTIKEDGTVQTQASVGDANVNTEIKPDGKAQTTVVITTVDEDTGEEKETVVTSSSDMTGSKTTLQKDGTTTIAVSQNAKVLDENDNELDIVIDLSVGTKTDGQTEHKIVAKDENENTLYEKTATSQREGSSTSITKDGHLETKADMVNEDGKETKLTISTDVNGHTIHSVDIVKEDGTIITTQATSEIEGATTVMGADGNLETTVSPKLFKMDGKNIEAVVKTLPTGQTFSRFIITDIQTGEQEIQETTMNSTSFEEGNREVITEKDGVLKFIVYSKVTKSIVF